MTETTDAAALRRRVYDAARQPAIRLSDTTLKLAQAGGVFHLNGAEADEITDAVMAVIEPVLAEHDRLAGERERLISAILRLKQNPNNSRDAWFAYATVLEVARGTKVELRREPEASPHVPYPDGHDREAR